MSKTDVRRLGAAEDNCHDEPVLCFQRRTDVLIWRGLIAEDGTVTLLNPELVRGR